MAKLMAPNIRIDWYPEGHFRDIETPLILELNSGVNLSPAIVTGFTLDFTDSVTVDTSTIYESFSNNAIAQGSYEANLQFFLAPRGVAEGVNEQAYRQAEEIFYLNRGQTGYLVKRFGYSWDTPYLYGQSMTIFKVQPTTPRILAEDATSPILMEVQFLPLGEAAIADVFRYEDIGIPISTLEKPRNILQGGDFDDLNDWSVTPPTDSMVTTTSHNDKLWGGLGGNLLLVTGNENQTSIARNIIVEDLPKGLWVGTSGYFANSTDSEITFIFRARYDSGGSAYFL